MFKNQPKGLYALALANTGERFGYYTMLAIFALFLQAKFGFNASTSASIYGGFLAAIYFLPVIGGILADKFGYGKCVISGILIMFIGYALMAIPTGIDTNSKIMMFFALFLIAAGTGLFKGNLQVMVGNLYDDPKYADKRDSAFSIFYMAINIGALFAPSMAEKITNWVLNGKGLSYISSMPNLAHQALNSNITDVGSTKLAELASTMPDAFASQGNDILQFSQYYLDQLSNSYHYAFGIACVSLIISIAIYLGFHSWFKHADVNTKQQAEMAKKDNTIAKPVELTKAQTKSRLIALGLVFFVVIFFWMAFHQNGLTLTWFARDYTASSVNGLSRISFDVFNLAIIIIAVYALFSAFQSTTKKAKTISWLVVAAAIAGIIIKYLALGQNPVDILPQKFQQFNPFFVVALTPVSMAIFGALAKKKREPSAPKKIGIGMFIAAGGYIIMACASFHLLSPMALTSTGGVSDTLVSPNVLINTYLVLTFAELFLSPMGISFVSKVAPPKYKGLMMGGWFAATAVGNYMTSIIGNLWGSNLPLWATWSVLIGLCALSGIFMFAMMKKLEKATAK
ncbi:MAG: peptide MFS transporter [Bacteroidales bacterium]